MYGWEYRCVGRRVGGGFWRLKTADSLEVVLKRSADYILQKPVQSQYIITII